MINLSDAYLMMIEPKKPAEPSIRDDITRLAERIWWARCWRNNNGYRGVHECVCGMRSDNYPWRVDRLDGPITNSLLIHYVECHRSEVPASEIEKLRKLGGLL